MERHLRLNWQALVDKAVARRKEHRLTQAQLAVLAGVSRPTVIQFEKGNTTLSIATAMKILHMLGLD